MSSETPIQTTSPVEDVPSTVVNVPSPSINSIIRHLAQVNAHLSAACNLLISESDDDETVVMSGF